MNDFVTLAAPCPDEAGDAFERERDERYRRLSLLTLALAEEAGEAAVDFAFVDNENRAGRFERRIATMTRAIWAHRTIERLRLGYVPAPDRARPEGRPFNPQKGALSGATPQKERAESARLLPERRPSAGFAAMDDDPDWLLCDGHHGEGDDDARTSSRLTDCIDGALADEPGAEAALAAAINPHAPPRRREPGPDPVSNARPGADAVSVGRMTRNTSACDRRYAAAGNETRPNPGSLARRGRADLKACEPTEGTAGETETFAEIYARAYRGDRDAIDKVVESIKVEKEAEAAAGNANGRTPRAPP